MKNSSSKVVFEPLLELTTEGVALEILVRGLLFLDVHFGISAATISAVGQCVCGAEVADSSEV